MPGGPTQLADQPPTDSPLLPLCILSQYYPPDFAATGELLAEIGEYLAGKGWKIFVITAQPSYVRAERAPTIEHRNGVQVRRVFSFTYRKDSLLGRILNAVSFFFSAAIHSLFFKGRKINLIVSNPPFLPFVGLLCKLLRNDLFVYIVHDVYPDIAVRLGVLRPDSWLTGLFSKAILRALESADRVVVLDDAMHRIVTSRLEKVSNKVTVISNWADGDWIQPLPREKNPFAQQHGLSEKFVILYSGNLALAHNLELLVLAAEELRHERTLYFVFIGDGGKKTVLEAMAGQRGLTNVIFFPYQPREMLPYSLTCGDLSVVAMDKGLAGLISPCKLYTSLAAGNPVLALAEQESPIARIVVEEGCGFQVNPGDLPAMVKVIRYALEYRNELKEMGHRARTCFENQFQKDRCLPLYASLLSNLDGLHAASQAKRTVMRHL